MSEGLFPISDVTADLLGRPDDSDDMLRTADLSDDGRYRWELRRTWGDPRRALTWIMLNPSTADALKDDPTIRRCLGFARRLGFDGIRVVNLYAFLTAYPKELAAAGWDTGGQRNDQILRSALAEAADRTGLVIAAWGADAQPERVAWLLDQPYARVLHALGTTLAGAPKHPLARGRSRIADDTIPSPWPGRAA